MRTAPLKVAWPAGSSTTEYVDRSEFVEVGLVHGVRHLRSPFVLRP
jgi:hypothetical protein